MLMNIVALCFDINFYVKLTSPKISQYNYPTYKWSADNKTLLQFANTVARKSWVQTLPSDRAKEVFYENEQ